ncbi:TetR/AcrR family transcriptional regulator [Kitasatospora purpeofusca]|uniref:TetR/AcrR family transcriptional regulator n=1 Tax=Kitasatospora purpeofusca TaxID=67352 RepID=UPI002A5A0072|nr:TetR/AcrR family transcriptional regulator [Kitasatospora purpeofusca]MDY0811907.1 TetR/AcrR family transcriptional regulator [Kitasatospora purpeofusca]
MAATVVNGQQPPPDKDHAAIAAQPRPAAGSRSDASRATGDHAVGGRAAGAARAAEAGRSGSADKGGAAKGAAAKDAAVSTGGSGRRSEAARLAVLNAADDLLVEQGFEGLTIEGIATAAGVAKQTIYRWWKSKVDILFDNLVLDAATGLAWPAETPADPADLRAYVHRFADFLGAAPAGKVLQALLGHAQLDARTAELLHGGFLDALRARDVAHTRACLGATTGEDGTEVTEVGTEHGTDEAAVLLDALLAPLYHRALVLRRPLDPAFVDALLDQHLPR